MTYQIIPKTIENLQQDFHNTVQTPEPFSPLRPKIKEFTIGLDTLSIPKAKWKRPIIPDFKETLNDYGFIISPRPWLPPRVLKKIEKMKRTQLGNKEMVTLIKDIARRSIDFYNLKKGSFVAIKFDGKIAESADKEIDLLMKIQGKNFDIPVFVWKVGSSSFAGWKA